MRLINKQALVDYMEFRGISCQKLADKVGCSKAYIGHLRTGVRTGCRAEWARAIEKHLDCPKGLLFAPKLSRVSQDSGQRGAA